MGSTKWGRRRTAFLGRGGITVNRRRPTAVAGPPLVDL
jgi:hypothetical protein